MISICQNQEELSGFVPVSRKKGMLDQSLVIKSDTYLLL